MKKVILFLALVLISIACNAQNRAFKSFTKHFGKTTAFAYVNLAGREVLLVSHEVFGNNEDDDLEAIATSIFVLDTDGKIVSLGSIRSQGTLYPVSVSDGKLMVAGHRFIKFYEIRDAKQEPDLVLSTYEEGDPEDPKLVALFKVFEAGKAVKFERKHKSLSRQADQQ